MSQNQRFILVALVLMLVALFGVSRCHHGRARTNVPAPPLVAAPPSQTETAPPAPAAIPATPKPIASSPKKGPAVAKVDVAVKKVAPAPLPAPVELHKELIPKDIHIVRVYYGQEIIGPASNMGFDINGSGFTQEFQKMITVDPGTPDIIVKNLKLVTANQIHGELEITENAATHFVYPQILIKGLPVFKAEEPFGVVRRGEVLTVMFIEMDKNGRSGKFRVLTNLDEDLAKQFHVEPSTAGLQIADVQNFLPFRVEGTLSISQFVAQGEYGLRMTIGDKEVYRRDGMIRIVRPNLGRAGLVQRISATDPFRRPGDTAELYLSGTGFSAEDIGQLTAHVDGFDMGAATFTYLSSTQIRFSFAIPPSAPIGSYGVTVLGASNTSLRHDDDVFRVVPAQWLAGVQVSPPVAPGHKSALRIMGRQLDADFAKSLRVETDEPGIHVTPFAWVNDSTVGAEISIDASVSPGDYWLHLTANGKSLKPQFGSLIKVATP